MSSNSNDVIVIDSDTESNDNDNQNNIINNNDNDNQNNNNEEEEDLRRSKRKRVSTIIKVQGYDVLAKNNYVVTGMKYVMDAHDVDAPKEKKIRKPSPTKASNSNNAPRKKSAAELARLQHNEQIKASVVHKESFRRNFLVQHRQTMEPFMDVHSQSMVERWSESKTRKTAYEPIQLTEQPSLIEVGEMRSYQLEGLNFMINMHAQNLGMILGDEMGLVS